VKVTRLVVDYRCQHRQERTFGRMVYLFLGRFTRIRLQLRRAERGTDLNTASAMLMAINAVAACDCGGVDAAMGVSAGDSRTSSVSKLPIFAGWADRPSRSEGSAERSRALRN